MARLLAGFPEIMVMLTGIAVAGRAVMVTMVLLTLVIYIFAIVFTQLCADNVLGDGVFKTVPSSMWTLFIKGNFPDLHDIASEISSENWFLMVIFLGFILLSAVTLLNMLVGILVDVVRNVAATEKEKIMCTNVKERLRLAMGMDNENPKRIPTKLCLDENRDGRINREEFENILLKPDAARMIQSVGVDVVELVDDAEFIFGDDRSDIDFKDFMSLVLQLRGSNKATVKDLMRLRQVVNTHVMNSEQRILDAIQELKQELHQPGSLGKPGSLGNGLLPVDRSLPKADANMYRFSSDLFTADSTGGPHDHSEIHRLYSQQGSHHSLESV